MKIKNHIWGWNHWMGSASLGLLVVSIVLVIGLPRLGQTSPIPGLSATLTSSNTLERQWKCTKSGPMEVHASA